MENKKNVIPVGGEVFLVRGEASGKPLWHYLQVSRLKRALFEQKLKLGKFDIAECGTVLHSGWGENPPPELVREMKERYGDQYSK